MRLKALLSILILCGFMIWGFVINKTLIEKRTFPSSPYYIDELKANDSTTTIQQSSDPPFRPREYIRLRGKPST